MKGNLEEGLSTPIPAGLPGPGPRTLVGALFLLPLAWSHPFLQQEPLLEGFEFSAEGGTRLQLPRGLEEISGLAVDEAGRLFAHNDERAVVYQIHPETGEILKVFAVGVTGVPGDFEGIAIAGERFFLLTSGGRLVEFREGEAGTTVRYRTHALGLGNLCELEGLAYDPGTDALLIPCKTPRSRRLAGRLIVWSVPLATLKPQENPRVFLPLQALDDAGLGDNFQPSAIEVHPQRGTLVLVAGRQEDLVEIGADGSILSFERLDRDLHPQPEGIAFLPDGSLVLADEGQGTWGSITRYVPVTSGSVPAP